ncbi:sensor histidine kinase [Halobacteriovorax sp. DA5]|uniref:sensor histidine kinase n=1 Tax=Halobacteriovorax sp. DA5 TaxID=2067553 RepID=UPI000CD096D2|nr:HAMP domain-containing sensor histidine kinase [Halobacteriovorax sp. DA5]POB15393.1 hypothetical protein C0Z22_03100 [Halobacteriovorax sp. DA5]
MRFLSSMNKFSNKHLFYSFIVIFIFVIAAGVGAGLRIFDKDEPKLFNARVISRLYFQVVASIHATSQNLEEFKKSPSSEALESAFLRADAILGHTMAYRSEIYSLAEYDTESFLKYLSEVDRSFNTARQKIEALLFKVESNVGYSYVASDLNKIDEVLIILERLNNLTLKLESESWLLSANVFGDAAGSFEFNRIVFLTSLIGLFICLTGFLIMLILKSRSDEELKEKNVELLNNYRLANLGEFAANVAHEINNPLTVLLWSVKRIEKVNNSDGEMKNLAMIRGQAERIDQIIKGIKLLSQNSNHLNNSPIDIEELFEHLREIIIHKCVANNIVLNIEGSCSGSKVWGKEVQLLQVFTNFIVNSIDAMEGMNNKKISIKYKTNLEDQLLIHIIDTGRGIDLKDQKKLFAYMYTSKPGTGMGIGLALSSQIIESLNGHIKYLNNEENTTFEIMLPLYR